MVDANSAKVHVTDLVPGTYVFKLTVTDDKKLTGSDTVKVHVKKSKWSTQFFFILKYFLRIDSPVELHCY